MHPELAGGGKLVLQHVDADDPHVVVRESRDGRREADTAQTHDGDARARTRLGHVDDGTAARQHRTAEDGGDVGRDVGVDDHERPTVDHGVRREPGDTQVVGDLGATVVQSAPPGQEDAGAVRDRPGLARRHPVGEAAGARSAAWQEGHDHTGPERQVGDLRADSPDEPRGLVAEQHRHGPRTVAVDDREVGVAHAGGLDLDQDLGRPGVVQLELDHTQGPGLLERERVSDAVQDCSADPHVMSFQRDMSDRSYRRLISVR